MNARVLTPAGRGAIAVVEVVGADAGERVDERFTPAGGRPLASTPVDEVRFGVWRHDGSDAGEEVVVVRAAEDRIEVHCHGGAAASRAVVDSLNATGAFAESRPASLEQDALRLLREAPPQPIAGVLLDQAGGAIRGELERAIAAIERGDVVEAGHLVDGLLRYRRFATNATRPQRLVIAGPPNVGKSSLLNAMVGYERAIAFDQPGTTRDVVTAPTAIAGWPVTLADTAGIREADDPLEQAGVDRAREALADADVVLLVREASRFASVDSVAGRARLLAMSNPAAAMIDVASKADLTSGTPPGLPAIATRFAEGAVADADVVALVRAIEVALAIDAPPAGGGAPFRVEHVERLESTREALAVGGDAAAPLRALLAGGDHPGFGS